MSTTWARRAPTGSGTPTAAITTAWPASRPPMTRTTSSGSTRTSGLGGGAQETDVAFGARCPAPPSRPADVLVGWLDQVCGFDHEPTRWPGRAVAGFIQDGSSGWAAVFWPGEIARYGVRVPPAP